VSHVTTRCHVVVPLSVFTGDITEMSDQELDVILREMDAERKRYVHIVSFCGVGLLVDARLFVFPHQRESANAGTRIL
jgi:hypothetical protein